MAKFDENTNIAADKLAVTEALYRFAAGIDLRDASLLASAFSVDAVSDVRPACKKAGFDYPLLEGRDNIVAALTGSLGSIITTHSVSNQRVHIDGDEARLNAYVEAQHVPINDQSRHYMMKNDYNVSLVRQDDIWVIQHMLIDNFWRSGDVTVMAGV